jgi:hypothetical protein
MGPRPGHESPPVEAGSEGSWLKQESQREAMVQTSPTSHADQPHVPGATAVRVLGVLLILQGGWKSYAAINFVVQTVQRGGDPSYIAFAVIMLAVIALLAISAGILLVQQDPAGRVFGLVACSIALAYQLFSFGSTLSYLYFYAASPMPSLGMLFWAINIGSIVLFLVGIIVIAFWRPHRLPGS